MKNIFNQFYLFFVGLLIISCQSKSSEVFTTSKENKTSSISEVAQTIDIQFESEIEHFEMLDKQNGYTKNAILFTGSSSIRKWSSLTDDMVELPVLNRGFGGSTIPEVLYFADRYIFQHNPQIIVFYCGENDISKGATPQQVFNSFKTFAELIEERLPKTELVYISMKPSLARWNLWGKYEQGEALISTYINEKPNIHYMDSSLSMLQVNGQVKSDIFIEDGLHMNANGYEGWTDQLKPILYQLYKP